MTSKIAFLGDCHGKFGRYVDLVNQLNGSGYITIQLGDLGYSYDSMRLVDPTKNFCIAGNHENHPLIRQLPHYLGDYGVCPFAPNIFFLSGGFSIDRKYRRLGIDFFYEEELSPDELGKAFDLYVQHKPDILITHEGARCFAERIGNPEVLRAFGFNPSTFTTRTSDAIQRMIDAHPPRLAVNGHYHQNREIDIGSTTFICLGELCWKILTPEDFIS